MEDKYCATTMAAGKWFLYILLRLRTEMVQANNHDMRDVLDVFIITDVIF